MKTNRRHSEVTFCICSLGTILCLGSSGSSLWGKKAVFMDQQSSVSYWQLGVGCVVPALKELSVCMDLQRRISSFRWTAFVYKSQGGTREELGLAGTGGLLQAWLFGRVWTAPADLPLRSWHTVCFTWSSVDQQLQLFVNGSRVLNASTHGPEHGWLPAHGSLTLGVSHGYVNGEMVIETGNNFLGEVSLFRMWGRALSPQQLASPYCVEGEVVRWDVQDWNTRGCHPLPDVGLQCAWSSYKIQMEIQMIHKVYKEINIKSAKGIVHHWLNDTFPRTISVDTVSISLSPSQAPFDNLDERGREEAQGGRTQLNSSFENRFDSQVYVSRTPSTDVKKTQVEISQLLSSQYIIGLLALMADSSTISVLAVEAFPYVTELPPVTLMGTSTVSLSTYDPMSDPAPDQQTTTEVFSPPSPVNGTSCSYPSHVFKDIFYEVMLTVTVHGTHQNTEEYVWTWVRASRCFAKEPDDRFKLFSTNKRSDKDVSPQTVKVPGVFYGVPLNVTCFPVSRCAVPFCHARFPCIEIQVGATHVTNAMETESRILALLTEEYSDSSVVIRALREDIHILQIDPGSCPQQNQQTEQGLYLWPQTEAQRVASNQCEGDPTQEATRFCEVGAHTQKAEWTSANLQSCPLVVTSVSDLDKITVTASRFLFPSFLRVDNSADVVVIIEDLTRNRTDLNPSELATVLDKLAEVVRVSEMTPTLGTSIIHIISDILQSVGDLQMVTNSILSLAESVGDKMCFSGETHNTTAPSLALSLFKVEPTQFSGLSFGVTYYSEGLHPEIFMNSTPSVNPVAFIYLPPVLENHLPQGNGTQHRVQFQFYGNLELFKVLDSSKELCTYVVSASVTSTPISNLQQPVTVMLRHHKPILQTDKVQCVYWDFQVNGQLGGWEAKGCRTNSSSANHTTCLCDHLTHFAVLLDLSRASVGEEDEHILTVITYLGCGLSSVFLGVSLLTYTAFEKLRRDHPSKILINLSVALLGLNLLFLVDSWLSSFSSHALCVSVAAALHYFLLASFTWKGLEAVHLYLVLVKVFNIYVPSYMLKFCVLGWGIPLVMISLVLAVEKDAYGQYGESSSEPFCWLQDDVVFFISVVGYVFLILLSNASVFVAVLIQIRNVRAKNPAGSHSGLLRDLRGMVSLGFLLGLTWILAFFTWGPAKLTLLYLFSILNSLQGFFIFVFHCLLKENVRRQWRVHLCCGRFKLLEQSDWSHSGTIGGKSVLRPSPSVKSAQSDNSTSDSSASDRQQASTRMPNPGFCPLPGAMDPKVPS